MAEPSRWLRVGCKGTTEDDKLFGGDTLSVLISEYILHVHAGYCGVVAMAHHFGSRGLRYGSQLPQHRNVCGQSTLPVCALSWPRSGWDLGGQWLLVCLNSCQHHEQGLCASQGVELVLEQTGPITRGTNVKQLLFSLWLQVVLVPCCEYQIQKIMRTDQTVWCVIWILPGTYLDTIVKSGIAFAQSLPNALLVWNSKKTNSSVHLQISSLHGPQFEERKQLWVWQFLAVFCLTLLKKSKCPG